MDFTRSLTAWVTERAKMPTPGIRSVEGDLTLNLFSDTALTLYVDRVVTTADQFGWTLYGTTSPAQDGRAILTFYGGALSGSVRLRNGEFYEIFVPADGTGEIRQQEFSGYPEGSSDMSMPSQEDVGLVQGSSLSERVSRTTQRGESPKDRGGISVRSASGNYVVDVLIAYTQRAADARGGDSGMLAYIYQVIAETNAAFFNSSVAIELRLVHTVKVIWDDSSPIPDYSSTLNALRSTTDGQMDEVHSLRDHYGADLVSLWMNPPRPSTGTYTVGQAYVLTSGPSSFATFAFSVVHQNYAGGLSIAFPHEVGHNMGLSHDVLNGGANGALFPDSRGYQQKTLAPTFYTVMAYSSGCSGCLPIDHYSNPHVEYESIPTGVLNEADAARTLAVVAPSASAWRGTVVEPTCSFSVGPTFVTVGADGGEVDLAVSSATDCGWTAQSNTGWITVISGANGSGNGSVLLTVNNNPGSASRTGSVTVAGRAVTVQQAGQPIAPALTASPQSVSLVAPVGSVSSVSAPLTVSTGNNNLTVTLVSTLPGWLTISTSSFDSPATLTLRTNPGSLEAGLYQTNLRFQCLGASNTILEVPVSFRVQAPPFLVSAPGLAFRVPWGSAPVSQILRVKESEPSLGTPLLQAKGGAWLSASLPGSSTIWNVPVRVNPAGLSVGIYDASVEIKCADAKCETGTVPVRLEVVAPPEPAPVGSKRATIGSGGIVNGASFEQGMASGSWMSIYGVDLANTIRTWNNSDFNGVYFPLSLDGVHVTVDGLAAPVQYVSPGQINFQAPFGIGEGWLSVEVSTPNGSDRSFAYAAPEVPAFFQFQADGLLAALHPDGQPVAPSSGNVSVVGRPVAPGTVIAIFGSGFGPTSPTVPTGQIYAGAAVLVAKDSVRITIGGKVADIEFVGLTAAGLNQLNAKVPDLPSGPQAVLAVINGSPTQFLGWVPVQ